MRRSTIVVLSAMLALAVVLSVVVVAMFNASSSSAPASRDIAATVSSDVPSAPSDPQDGSTPTPSTMVLANFVGSWISVEPGPGAVDGGIRVDANWSGVEAGICRGNTDECVTVAFTLRQEGGNLVATLTSVTTGNPTLDSVLPSDAPKVGEGFMLSILPDGNLAECWLKGPTMSWYVADLFQRAPK